MLVKYQVLADGGVPANTALRDCIESEPGHLIASANFLCNLRLLDLITDQIFVVQTFHQGSCWYVACCFHLGLVYILI